jgi:hypothetical protein
MELTSAIGGASARAPSVLMSCRLPPLLHYWQFAPRVHRGVPSVPPHGGPMNATLVVVGCIIDLLANCKLRHRELLFGIIENLNNDYPN